jgi:hypothetical protein
LFCFFSSRLVVFVRLFVVKSCLIDAFCSRAAHRRVRSREPHSRLKCNFARRVSVCLQHAEFPLLPVIDVVSKVDLGDFTRLVGANTNDGDDDGDGDGVAAAGRDGDSVSDDRSGEDDGDGVAAVPVVCSVPRDASVVPHGADSHWVSVKTNENIDALRIAVVDALVAADAGEATPAAVDGATRQLGNLCT